MNTYRYWYVESKTPSQLICPFFFLSLFILLCCPPVLRLELWLLNSCFTRVLWIFLFKESIHHINPRHYKSGDQCCIYINDYVWPTYSHTSLCSVNILNHVHKNWLNTTVLYKCTCVIIVHILNNQTSTFWWSLSTHWNWDRGLAAVPYRNNGNY